jgi:predicted nuclease of predicted toxin-antitoxin system
MFTFSFKLVKHLTSIGFEVRHVNDMPNRWHSTDLEIAELADQQDYILISKDVDFKNRYLVKHSPKKLIKINLGNLSNQTLIQLVTENLTFIETLNQKGGFLVEIDQDRGATAS